MAEGSSRFTEYRRRVKEGTEERLDSMYSILIAQPKTTLLLMLIMSAWFANVGADFKDQIVYDVEIFLPEDAESSDLLLEVREEWSTDVAIIYVQTRNVEDPLIFTNDTSNISNVDIMHELSWIEGDDEIRGPGLTDNGIDWDKEDHGRNDGVLWIISFPQIVKEINSSDGRFESAMCDNTGERITMELIDCTAFEASPESGGGLYAIPDEQRRIDEIVSQADGGFDALVKDTNGDGVWDTTAIIIGMHHDMSTTDFADNFRDFFQHVEDIISEENRPQEYRKTTMTQTGLSKILEDISESIYDDLLNMMPISLLLTIIIITLLHRSWKVVIITGAPILMALAVTFGMSVLLDMTLTPMIVATFPILIGLGVDYALHMVNRIEEVRRKRIDKAVDELERRRRKGQVPNEVPDIWDTEFYRSCVIEMANTTGIAVLLSAATTVIGFSVLIAPNIVSIVPIRSVGLTLVVGILSTLVFSMILVPTLAWLLKFNKRTSLISDNLWGSISKIPIKHFAVVLLLTGSLTIFGLSNMDEMDKPITGSSEAPEGIDSMDAMVEYSNTFSGGQTSLFIFDVSKHANQEEHKIRNLSVLDAMDALEERIGQVNYTNTTSVITFLKAIPVSLTEPTTNLSLYEGSLWDLLHDECWTSNSANCATWILLDATSTDGKGREHLRNDMVNVAFDTLSKEVQWMLTNEFGDKALVYVTQPYINLRVASELRDDIDDMLNEPMEEPGIETSKLTGGLPVSLDINEGIHDTQNYTTILTLIILTIVMMIVFRSPRLGFYTMIPVAVVIIWQPLLMTSDDVNVNIFTAMIGTIVFGIGVDDAIHVMHRIVEEGETAHGMSKTIEKTGQTIFETTATTVAGLGAGFFVAFPGLENFFILMMLLIAFAFLTSAFLLPAALTAHHIVAGRIRGGGDFIDFGDGVVLTDERMEAVDAILE
ncbi:MAG: MMPL family transporter [Candidatus Poseidoniaceae archaeon]|nr:MMPL family transporter [Candidatus Poseidoniaceae archaeon]